MSGDYLLRALGPGPLEAEGAFHTSKPHTSPNGYSGSHPGGKLPGGEESDTDPRNVLPAQPRFTVLTNPSQRNPSPAFE